MRYIDDMIKGIPLEEMTGGTDMKENEIKGLIPDEPYFSEPSRESIIEENKVENEHPRETPADDKEITVSRESKKGRAAVRSRALGGIAAAVALAVTAGGVLTYLGASKGIGPLAALSDKSESRQAEDVPAAENVQKTANYNAKLVFTSLNGLVADLVSSGRMTEIPRGTFRFDLSMLGAADLDQEFLKLFEALQDDGELRYGEAAFFINDQYKPEWAQWRSSEGSDVGQYPKSGDDVEFGKVETGNKEGFVKVSLEGRELGFSGMESSPHYDDAELSSEDVSRLMKAIGEKKVIPEAGENSPQLSGEFLGISFTLDDGTSVSVMESERVGAPLVINGEYCECEYASQLIDKLYRDYHKDSRPAVTNILSCPNFTEEERIAFMEKYSDYRSFSGFPMNEEEEARLIKWYEDFLAANYEPVADPGDKIEQDIIRSVKFDYNGSFVQIVNTEYAGANVQINRQFYNVKDTSVFDLLEEHRQRLAVAAENDPLNIE